MDINPIWLRYGIIYGLVSIVFSLVIYYVVSMGLGTMSIISFIIMIVILVIVGRAQRQENNDILPYGEALKTTFLTGLVGVVISTLFTIILVNLIDPSLVEKLTEMGMDAARSMMEAVGMPEDKLAEAMEKAEEESVNGFTPTRQLLGIFQSSIFVLIVAAIVSIFIKKDEKFA
ncbi:MAG: DUF4199 domain-containing protein [Saprospiraceae bacterium]|nr:DUF4199 domain-containing protein [Saprospiraceae bacterium]